MVPPFLFSRFGAWRIMQLDLSAQGWTAGVNAALAFVFLLLPPLKRLFDAQPQEYQVSIRGIAAIVLALLFVGGSCAGLWNDIACTKTDILSFAGNVVIASVLGFQVSGGVLHIKSTAQAFKAQRALRIRSTFRN